MPAYRPVEERFWGKVQVRMSLSNDCWEWMAGKTKLGYGFFGVARKTVLAHRFAYEYSYGNIPEGLELDHLCRNPSCVNPSHLEAVTHRENIIRGLGPALLGKRNSDKAYCPQGHPYSKENTYITPKRHRNCLICRRKYDKARKYKGGVANGNKTHCPKGHEYNEANTTYETNSYGRDNYISRRCKICARENAMARYHKKKRGKDNV